MAEFRHGFKAHAKRLADEERSELGLRPTDALDPWRLADNHGVQVLALSELDGSSGPTRDAIDYFTGPARGAFSALLLPVGTGVAVVENDAHVISRRRSNLSHEMGHLLLEHEFGHVLYTDGCRKLDPSQEKEALWLSGELLSPRDGALRCAREGDTDQDVAELFEVSVPFARMRLNTSGVRKQVVRERIAKNRRKTL